MPLGVELIDGLRIGAPAKPSDAEPGMGASRGPVFRQPKPVGVGGVEKQLLGRAGEDDVRIPQIKGDIPFVFSLVAERIGHVERIFEGVGENKPAPPAVNHYVLPDLLHVRSPGWIAPVLQRRGVEPPEPEIFPVRFPHVFNVVSKLLEKSGFFKFPGLETSVPGRRSAIASNREAA